MVTGRTTHGVLTLLLALALSILLALGCAGGAPGGLVDTDSGSETTPSQTTDDNGDEPTDEDAEPARGTFTLKLAWDVDGASTRVIPTGTDHINLRILPAAGADPELTDTIDKSEVSGGEVTRTYDLLPGDGKILEIDAVDAGGQIVAQASITIDITAAAVTQVNVTLDSTGILNPVVSASADPASARPGGSITLTGTASDPDGSLAKLEWDADGDGTYESSTTNCSSGEYTVTVTPALGDYTGVFRATDNDGLTNTASVSYSIQSADPELGVSPGSLSFDSVTGELTLAVSNGGDDDLTWEATASDSWLGLSPASGTNDATVTVTLARGDLSAGNHSTTIDFTSNGGSATVDVDVEVTRAEIIVD
ncbi:MAG: hypothetical protein GF320_16960 [Armatimonadia bacterium]|nr:hypothetical protein [Armatimonadia bacterium]